MRSSRAWNHGVTSLIIGLVNQFNEEKFEDSELQVGIKLIVNDNYFGDDS